MSNDNWPDPAGQPHIPLPESGEEFHNWRLPNDGNLEQLIKSAYSAYIMRTQATEARIAFLKLTEEEGTSHDTDKRAD